MGQKVNPTGIRLGIVKDWSSIWYAERGEYADHLNTDISVREHRLPPDGLMRTRSERPNASRRISSWWV